MLSYISTDVRRTKKVTLFINYQIEWFGLSITCYTTWTTNKRLCISMSFH